MEVTTVWRVNGIEYNRRIDAELVQMDTWGVVGGIVVWNVEWVDVSTFEDLAVGKTVYIATRIYTNTERE